MPWQIPCDERTYLRGLAKRQAEIAALPVMAERLKMWYALNDGPDGAARPPVIIETNTFWRDFMPESVYRCQSDAGRTVEHQLLRNIRNHELIDDDKVIPPDFKIGWFVDVDEFGVKIEREDIKDSDGIETGYRWKHPIKDLRRDLDLLKPARASVDRDRTAAWQAFLEELFGGLLPVRLASGPFGRTMLTNRVIELMGMELFFMSMYDCPEAVHRLMAYLRDNSLRLMRWAEGEGLLRVNNGNDESFGSSFNFTTRLPLGGEALAIEPAAGNNGPAARLCDMWGSANSQETVGVSPEMFHEFCFPYYRDAVEPLGLVYYGCCEPAHPFWDDLRQLPHLKKVSISRWCDEAMMGEALRGSGIIYSRKPDPNFLSVDRRLNEDAWREHIRRTLELTRGASVEFIIRDVYTVHGDLSNARRAVQCAREEIDRHWKP